MKVEGRSIAQIGAELGVATRTLHVPANHGDSQAPCVGPWDTYERISENTKLRALDSIMDRVDQTTKLRDRAEAGADGNTVNYLQVIQNMPDEELAGMLRAWGAGTNGDSAHPALPESS
jgi:hypothetical protein